MNQNVKIYKENYENLPGRFIVKIEHDIRYLLERDIAGPKRVYLFGSCARGNVRSSSDVDLMVVTEQKISDRALAGGARMIKNTYLDIAENDLQYLESVIAMGNTI